ncbi:MAG: DNA recombination protein RmuC [Nitrospirae bacterium]|nr:DNA recombination protein RmuC [Nitrospirota bacterium]MCL5284391.1 DNA recombination protein RmuC [Nitrospirota bacterium]
MLLAVVLAGLASLFSLLVLLRSGGSPGGLPPELLSRLLREESDRIRQSGEEQARLLRTEQAELLRAGFDQVRGTLGEGEVREAALARALREELLNSVTLLAQTLSESLRETGTRQKEVLETMSASLATLAEKNERTMDQLRQGVEGRLDALRTESQMKLDEMRRTVDEKLQTTLETRLGESFGRVAEQLERVHKSLGEMQTLATGVGDLKRVLSNVRTRGTFGEVQLEALLEQFLSPEQYVKNAQVREHSQERVEFAIRLPGRDAEGEVLLPIDAKFPQEDYERMMEATEKGDPDGAAQASKDLEARIRGFARTIREKYIEPPRTTDFAILFLPTEGLYAEILRRPGLFEQLQREFHITLSGPTTLTAMLNALQMGFRSLAIERRSGEVWKILGAVRQEFGKYNEVVEGLSRQLSTAASSVKKLGTRTRAMDRKLRDVERLPETEARQILGEERESLREDFEEDG